jgi:predicted ATP-grasp superfamily ATP-dependent carboligase
VIGLNMDKNGVIIIGGNVQGLGLLRTFARNNIKTILINNKKLDIVKFSKYLKKYIVFKKMNEPIELKNFLIHLAENKKLNDWIILPTEDSVVYTLSMYKSELEQYYKIPTPKWDIIKYTYDKKLTYLLAEKLGMPIPKTFYPKDINDVVNISENVNFPCLLKPSVMHRFYNLTGKKLLKVDTKNEMIKSYKAMAQLIPPSEILIQEIISGTPKNPISFGCFIQKDLLCWVMIAKKRMIPIDFGVGTYNETIKIPELKELSLKILNEIGYSGLCEVEYIKDPKDKTYKFLEINPRSWLQITITNQTNKPLIPLVYYYYQNETDKLNKILTDNAEEFPHIKWIHFWQDLYVSVFEALKGNLNFNDYLDTFKGKTEFAVASWDDPLPFMVEPVLYCISSIKKRMKKKQ